VERGETEAGDQMFVGKVQKLRDFTWVSYTANAGAMTSAVGHQQG